MRNIEQLDLNLLRVFDALMETQNLSRAAARLHLSQPAASNALARLRAHVGEPLFVRTARGMQPTERARALHGPVRQALRLIAEGLHDGDVFEPSTSEQGFTLSMNDYAQAWVLPALAARLRVEAPAVTLSVHADDAETIPARLASGALDLAIDYLHFDAPELVYTPLTEESLVVIARARHPLLRGGLTQAKFAAAHHVAVHPRAGRGAPLEIVLGAAKVRRAVRMHVPFYLAMPAIVAQSDLIGTVPRRLAERFAALFPIAIAPLPFAMPKAQVSLIGHKRKGTSRAHTWLRARIVEVVRESAHQDTA